MDNKYDKRPLPLQELFVTCHAILFDGIGDIGSNLGELCQYPEFTEISLKWGRAQYCQLKHIGDHRVIWAQFYDHEDHEEQDRNKLLLKINETADKSIRKTNPDSTLVRSRLMCSRHTKRTIFNL